MTGIPRVKNTSRLQLGRFDVDRHLPIHAVGMHNLTRWAQDEDAYSDIVLCRKIDAGSCDLLRLIGRDLVLDQSLFRGFIRDDELVDVLSGGAGGHDGERGYGPDLLRDVLLTCDLWFAR